MNLGQQQHAGLQMRVHPPRLEPGAQRASAVAGGARDLRERLAARLAWQVLEVLVAAAVVVTRSRCATSDAATAGAPGTAAVRMASPTRSSARSSHARNEMDKPMSCQRLGTRAPPETRTPDPADADAISRYV